MNWVDTAPSRAAAPIWTPGSLHPLLRPPFGLALRSAFHPHAPFALWLLANAPPRLAAGEGEAFDAVQDLAMGAGLTVEWHGAAAAAPVDLLVLDGSWTAAQAADAASRWQARLAPGAAVLVHRINPGEGGSLLWRALSCERPPDRRFAFAQGAGLGLLLAPGHAPPALRALCALPAGEAADFTALCAVLGAGWTASRREAEAALAAAQGARDVQLAHRRTQALIDRDRRRAQDEERCRAAAQAAAAAALKAAQGAAQSQIAAHAAQAAAARRALETLTGSTSWQIARRLAVLAGWCPPPLRVAGRRLLRGAWWIATAQLGARLRHRRSLHRPAGTQPEAATETEAETAEDASVPVDPPPAVADAVADVVAPPPRAASADDAARLLGRHLPAVTLFPVTVGFAARQTSLPDLRRALDSAGVALGGIGQRRPGSILLVDDHAAADLAVLLPPDIACLPPRGPAGYAAAHNRMMEAAFAAGAEVYVAAHPGGVFDPDALVALLRLVRNSRRRALVEAWRPDGLPKPVDPDTFAVPWSSGACLAIPRPVFEATGGFDAALGAWGADIDLSWRARAFGFALLACPDAMFRLPSAADDPGFIPTASLAAALLLARKWCLPATEAHVAGLLRDAGEALPHQPMVSPPESIRSAADFGTGPCFAEPPW